MRLAWHFHRLTCEVNGGSCRSYNISLSSEECSNTQQLFNDHKRRFASVTVFGLVTSPHEYRGMELVLTLELFLPRSGRLPGGVLGVSCLIFKLWCPHCVVQSFPATQELVLRFRKEHRQHIQNVRLFVVVQTSNGRPIRQQLQVRGEHEFSNFCPQQVTEELRMISRLIASCLSSAIEKRECASITPWWPVNTPISPEVCSAWKVGKTPRVCSRQKQGTL